ncbi:MAG: PilN domain-containing protein [Pseudomonadales bacterium]|jgi:type IV pilus assembly protein PilN|nr:PilN domain-containing protein [Pseudomonadales bacterium]
MHEFNFLPWREQERARRKTDFLRLLGGAAFCALLLLYGNAYTLRQRLAAQELQHSALGQQLATLESPLSELRALREQHEILEQQLTALQTLQAQRASAALLLDALARALPPSAYYTALERQSDLLRLNGMASGNELTALMQALALVPGLGTPQLHDITTPRPTAQGAFALSLPLPEIPEETP